MPRTSLPRFVLAAGLVTIVAAPASVAVNAQAQAQGLAAPRLGVPAVPPPERPVVLYTAAHPRIRVVPVATGLSHPWSMAFRRNGDILVTERDSGALRIVRDGQLLERPVPGVPEVYTGVRLAGLMDIAVHPDDDAIVYLTYSKGIERDGREGATVALARGRLDGGALTEVRDIFVAEGIVGAGISASRALFGPDGKLYVTVGGAFQFAQNGGDAQDPANHVGKLIRLNADGSVPEDNPFVGEAGHLPEIFSMGHRNQIGLAFHPQTGELWATENGPQGGRRGEHHPRRRQLRLAPRVLQPAVRRAAGDRHAVARRVHRSGDRLVAVHRAVRPDVLHGRAFPGLEGQPVRRVDDGRPHGTHRAPGADRLQPPGAGDPARVAAQRAAPADPGRAAGAGRVSLRADGGGRRGAAADRAGAGHHRAARQHRSGRTSARGAGPAAAGSGMDRSGAGAR